MLEYRRQEEHRDIWKYSLEINVEKKNEWIEMCRYWYILTPSFSP